MHWIKSLSWPMVIIIVLLLGLAPFKPEPHVIEKITMLLSGNLNKPIDIFDLFLHATPWILFFLKLSTLFTIKQALNKSEPNE